VHADQVVAVGGVSIGMMIAMCGDGYVEPGPPRSESEMKYFIRATPGPMPPAPEQFDAALDWIDQRLGDGTFDCVFGHLEGGGFAVANVGSHGAALELMADYPLFGLVVWEVRPLLELREGSDTIRAKLAEAQAAMGGG
jgi:hypothetical protein